MRDQASYREMNLCGMRQAVLQVTAVFSLILPVLTAQTLTPGQAPAGAPPKPGQLGPAPAKVTTESGSAPATGTIGDVIGSETVDIRVTTRNVLVPTTVYDADKHGYVNGIQTNEFELFDNNNAQHISAEFTQLPLSVVLAVQANSDIEPVLPKLKKAGLLLHGLVTGEGGDVAILAFDNRMQLLQDFTSDSDRIDDAMQKLRSGSSSARLIDAVDNARSMLKHHDPANSRRHVILLLSRNIDRGSEMHLNETVRRLQFENVIIYCVDISKVLTSVMKQPDLPRPANGGIPAAAMPNIGGGVGARTDTTAVQEQTGNIFNVVPPLYRGVRDLFKKTPAEAFTFFTGGQIYSFASNRALEDAITDIGKDLNSQYLLSYAPMEATREEPGFHTIRVAVNRPGLQIRTRPGYWWGGGKQ